MDNWSEQNIEKLLKTLADIHPSVESTDRMQKQVRNLIADRCRSDVRSFLVRHKEPICTIAAATLIVTGLLALFRPIPTAPPPPGSKIQGGQVLSPTSMGTLNRAFDEGGMEAVEDLLKEFMKMKKPEPEIKSIDDATNGRSEKEP